MSYQLTLVADAAGFVALEEAWTGLLAAVATATIFASWQWNFAWWHHWGDAGSPYIVAVRDSRDGLVGLAPLWAGRVGPWRRLTFLGNGLSDAGDFLLHPAHAAPAAAAIFAFLYANRRAWDLLDLDEVPATSPLGPALDPAPRGYRLLVRPRNDNPVIPLPPTWEDYTRSLKRKPRYVVEGLTQRFVREQGAEFLLVTAPEDCAAAVADLYRLHRARWASRPDELTVEHRLPAFVPFLTEVCRRCARQGWLRLGQLRVDGTTIAAALDFALGDHWEGYLTGFDPAWQDHRPGRLLDGFILRAAIHAGAGEYHYGRGDEGYKYEMGALARRSRRFVLATGSPRSVAAFTALQLRGRGRDLLRRLQPAPLPL